MCFIVMFYNFCRKSWLSCLVNLINKFGKIVVKKALKETLKLLWILAKKLNLFDWTKVNYTWANASIKTRHSKFMRFFFLLQYKGIKLTRSIFEEWFVFTTPSSSVIEMVSDFFSFADGHKIKHLPYSIDM